MTNKERQEIRDEQDKLIKHLLSKGLTDLNIVIETPLQIITMGNLQSFIYPQFKSIIQELLKNKEMTKWIIR